MCNKTLCAGSEAASPAGRTVLVSGGVADVRCVLRDFDRAGLAAPQSRLSQAALEAREAPLPPLWIYRIYIFVDSFISKLA